MNDRMLPVLSQKEVARRLRLPLLKVRLAEQSAIDKLRANPEAKLLLRYIAQQNAEQQEPSVEAWVLRKINVAPGDETRFLTISGFAPNL